MSLWRRIFGKNRMNAALAAGGRVNAMARRRKKRLIPALMLGAALALIVGCLIQQRAIDAQNARIEELRAQRDQLIESNALMRERIEFTYTDEYFRREAHRQGYLADDETLYNVDGLD